MKKSLCILLAMCMTGTMLAGCGDNADTPSSSVGGSSQDSSKVSSEVSNAEVEKKLDPITMSLFIDHSWFWIDSFGGRTVDDEITRLTGISFDVTKAADDKQLQILIGSGSYPDIVYTGTTSLWPKLANSNVSYDWNSLIEQYAPDFPVSDIEIANATQPDGKFYTIYNAYSTPEEWASEPRMLPSNGTSTLHVRQDIMEALGNPKLETLDDLENVLGMVKEKYPEMDGILLGENLYGLPYFRYCFADPTGGTRLYYDENAGEVKYQVEAPEYKAALQYLNRLYRKGYITAESLIYQVEQYRQKVYSGEAFAIVRSVTESQGANTAFKEAGFDTYKFVPVENLLSENPLYVNDSIGWSGTYITKSCKYPDRAIQLMSLMKSKEGQMLSEFGVEGVTYTIGEDGYPVLTDEVKAVKAESYTKMVDTYGLACWNFGVSAATEAIFNWNPKEPEILNTLQNVGKVMEFHPWFQFVLPVSGTDLRDTYSKIGTFVDEERFKLVAAESEDAFETGYAQMVKTCEDMCLGQVKAYVNEQYPEIIKNYK